ncbi:D-alanine--D-alanine ligase [Aureimonas altamirensis]|jgi:D-alanine-D-alanine ligase|uniref:D-alanine--D-alanine ligase n=1 Tax=Aureimonas altamirensis DSM 21988 TaxID=1121026 RepID=A0ABY1IMX1_9HYPH|nr:D-alanine--D-alanine ligase [Aureimonas altamirensis]SHJ51433.1 D-alanine-D-alanine ligase [Aureimonas altamirensis DSM 21988]
MQRHVAVLMGGLSSERPVSLSSGKACADALEAEGYRVTRIDVGRDVASVLSELRPDVAFNALHGPFGEDGTIQGILEYLEIPYTHSGVLASALAMNKEKAKAVVAGFGVNVAESILVDRMEIARQHAMPTPYVVKPVAEGSSFGVVIVREGEAHPPQQLSAVEWTFGDMVMVERYVPGRELTCAVMGDEVLGVCEIVSNDHAFYDFDAKYAPGGSSHIVPAELPDEITATVAEFSLAAHRAVGCRGVSRSDFRYDDRNGAAGEVVWLEVNTQPGMTPTSLVPDIARARGLEFGKLLDWMVRDASCRR